MHYLKCKHCNHLNEVKSEYLVVCGLCNRKLEDNYKDWHVRYPNKSFEDFKREVCLTEEEVQKGSAAKSSRKKNKNGAIAGWIGALLVIALIALIVTDFKKTYDTKYGDAKASVLEQQWYTGTYSGNASLSTPAPLKSMGSLTDGIPEDMKKLLKTMEGHMYRGSGIDFAFMYTEYVPEVEAVDLDMAAEGGLAQMKGQPGVFDFKSDKAYTMDKGFEGVVIQGTYVKGGTEYEYNVTLYKDGMKLYQLLCSNKKGDETARGIFRRVYDSFTVLGHETQIQHEDEGE